MNDNVPDDPNEKAYFPASPDARNLVIKYLTTIIGDGGRSETDDAKLAEVVNELRCQNETDAETE
jgi:hypothetical protein